MTLVLEVEYLTGVSFAAIGPDSAAPEWPPQPDRIFSALVATWASCGEDEGEAAALEWLERLPPPLIQASAAEPRVAPIVFVPPNDPRSDRQKHAKGVLPSLRGRQARRFPATRPSDPLVRLLWPEAAPQQGTLDALRRLARDTAYVGHSASLTRCRFVSAEEAPDLQGTQPSERRVYDGRLAELRRDFAAGQRSLRGTPVRASPPVDAPRGNLFGEKWLILEHVAGDMPDLRASALVAKMLRDAILSGYRQIGLGERVPEVISGHDADGGPTRTPHVAIVPLPHVGSRHAQGHVMGFALIPPAGVPILDDEDFRRALRRLAPLDEDHGRRILRLRLPEAALLLSPSFEAPAGKQSLDSRQYLRRAETFATVTPIVLDRHLKSKGDARQDEAAALIAAACRNVGLPEPAQIVVDKHSALEGAVSAYPSGSSPRWLRWRLPESLASRQLTHAVIRFAEPVPGPVILGAGRFVGLGLCRPLDAARSG